MKEKQGGHIGPEELEGEEHKQIVSKGHTDDEENTQMGKSEEDEEQMRRDLKEETRSLQARGDEGRAESGKNDRSVRGESPGIDRATPGEVESSGHEKTKEDSITGGNSKTAELKETNAEDAPENVKEKLTYSGEQGLNERRKTEKQKQRGNEDNMAFHRLYVIHFVATFRYIMQNCNDDTVIFLQGHITWVKMKIFCVPPD